MSREFGNYRQAFFVAARRFICYDEKKEGEYAGFNCGR